MGSGGSRASLEKELKSGAGMGGTAGVLHSQVDKI